MTAPTPVAAALASRGQHFTPPPIADLLLACALDGYDLPRRPLQIIDPACGRGDLLRAASRALPHHPADLLGVEIDPAVAEAARAATADLAHPCAILTADALTRPSAPTADLVLLNPPYLGEKGNKALFDELASTLDPSRRSRLVARMDYLYLFLHLALDLLRPGGRAVAITTAYWPAATSARALRADLLARSRLLAWVRFTGRPLFEGATGQHNLALVFERADAPLQPPAPRWIEARWDGAEAHVTQRLHAAPTPDDPGPWQPFVPADDAAWLDHVRRDWLPLGALAIDRQGIVSGCDRVTPRLAATLDLPPGSPGFIWRAAELRAAGFDRDPDLMAWLKPLLRGSDVAPLDVRAARPRPDEGDSSWIIHTHDATPPPAPLLHHLERLRAVLGARREVRTGRMPWFRLHWPRDPNARGAPRLVAPRRAPDLRFALDLAAHAASSDCTTLSARPGLHPPDLLLLWLTLHLHHPLRYLRLCGKHKGKLLELYSEPLISLRLPLRYDGDRLTSLDPAGIAALAEEVRSGPAWEALAEAGWTGWFDKAAAT